MRLFAAALGVVASAAACTSAPPVRERTILSTQGTTLVRGAEVTDVRDITVQETRSGVLGGIVGSVLGGLAGSTIGGGNGSAIAGVGGAIAGGAAGQRVDRAAAGASHATELTVRFDNGEQRTYRVARGESFRIGERVKVTSSPGGTRVTH